MRTMKFLKIALVAAALLSSAVAQASLINFDLSGSYTAHWQIDSTMDPNDFVDGTQVRYYPFGSDFAGTTDGRAEIDFYAINAFGGGFVISDYQSANLLASGDGVQLYAENTEAHPVFNLGTFVIPGDAGASYTLKISDAAAGTDPGTVPEPASTALLAGGLGLMLLAKKRRSGK